MIGHLRGGVLVRDALTGTVVLDVGGVGYQLTVSWQTFAEVPEVGATTQLWVHTHVREDALTLFGFVTTHERRMFQLLTSVPQVGPKNAVAVLGGLPLDELLGAVSGGDQAMLQRIPGVGKRTAERIILDLRDKAEALAASIGTPTGEPTVEPAQRELDHDDEARAVLVNLGWKPKAVDAALAAAHQRQPAPTDLDTLVRCTLASLMAR